MKLAELRELPLPPTNVAEGAWDAARRRRRRTTVACVAVAAVLIGSTAVGVGMVRDGEDPVAPSPAPALPTPGVSTPPTVTDLPDFAALAATVPILTPTDPTYLSQDPVDRAVAAIVPTYKGEDSVWAVIDVLGEDRRWRYVDVPGLERTHDQGGNPWYALSPTSLNADGTRLALPQPGRIIIVELTTGQWSSYGVPGLNKAVVWKDADHVLVTAEGSETGRVLDLTDLSVTQSTFTASTTFLPDGSWVTWGYGGRLVDSRGTSLSTEVRNDAGAQRTAPLVDDDVAVGLGSIRPAPSAETQTGVVVVDRRSGALRGFLPTLSPGEIDFSYLLALDDDVVTVAVVLPDRVGKLVLQWSWRTGEVTPVAVLPAGMVSGSLQ